MILSARWIQKFYLYTLLLSNYTSSFFILLFLRIYPLRLSKFKNYSSLVSIITAFISGYCIHLVDHILMKCNVPLPYSYLRISVISILVIFGFVCLLYSGNRIIMALSVLLLFNIYSSIRFMLEGILRYFIPIPTTKVRTVICEPLTFAICLVIAVFVPRLQKGTVSGLSKKENIIWLAVATANMIFMCQMPRISSGSTPFDKITLSGDTIFTSTVIYILFYKHSREAYDITERQKIMLSLKSSETMLTQMKESNTQLQELRHEIKNHIFYLEELEKEGKYEDLQQYLSKMKQHVLSSKHYIFTENQVIDSILSQKRAYGISLGMDFSIAASKLPDMDIDEITLCSILGNLIDNALEGAAQTDAKKVSVEIRPSKGYLFIEVKNSAPENSLYLNRTLQTTKKDRKNHGIGHLVVEQLTHEYNGTVRYQMLDPHTFSVRVLLQYTKGAEKRSE